MANIERAGRPEQQEILKLTWEDFKAAVAVYQDDLNLVNHTDHPKTSPFKEPNKPGLYSLTQIPEDMTEDEFLNNLEAITDICVTCMDKDCAHSTWQKLHDEGQKNVMMLTFGGGVVQHGEDRVNAQVTMAHYLAQKHQEGFMPKLEKVHCDDHNHVCGAVKFWLGGESLPELLSRQYGRQITPNSREEDLIMEQLIRDGAFLWQFAFAKSGVRVVAELHVTDRQDASNSTLKSTLLDPHLPKMSVAALADQKAMLDYQASAAD